MRNRQSPVDVRRREVFARYVLPELDVLLRTARALTPQLADAEDLVQETLLRAYRAADAFDGRHPRAWLFTIMRRVEANRRRRPEFLHDRGGAILDRLEVSDNGSVNPETLVVESTFDARVAAALSGLPEKYRRVVELVDAGGLRYTDAATVLGLTEGTVASRLHRARARLKRAVRR